jgi:hypothetical protein
MCCTTILRIYQRIVSAPQNHCRAMKHRCGSQEQLTPNCTPHLYKFRPG